jgi:hypothetical protein
VAGADTDKGVSCSSCLAPNRYTASQYAVGGASTSPQDRDPHQVEASLELLEGPLNEVQPSYAAVPAAPLDDHEGVLLVPKLARNSPEDNEIPSTSNASRAVKLGKHGRPHSQTSQGETGTINDVTRPPRRQVCHIVVVHSGTISVPV